jgi:hypothetical protein
MCPSTSILSRRPWKRRSLPLELLPRRRGTGDDGCGAHDSVLMNAAARVPPPKTNLLAVRLPQHPTLRRFRILLLPPAVLSIDSGVTSVSILFLCFLARPIVPLARWKRGRRLRETRKRGTMREWRSGVDRATDAVIQLVTDLRTGFVASATERAPKYLDLGSSTHRRDALSAFNSLRQTREVDSVTTSRQGVARQSEQRGRMKDALRAGLRSKGSRAIVRGSLRALRQVHVSTRQV